MSLCEAGWIGVLLESGNSPKIHVAESIADLVTSAGPVDVAGMEIPIGLGVDQTRAADQDARFLVRDRQWLVAPIREALLASSHA